MADQVLHFARALRERERTVTNVVFMGMGEPFHNYDETLRACRLLNDPAGFDLARVLSPFPRWEWCPASTGFSAEPLQLHLAVSLHAGTDDLRDRLVPLKPDLPAGRGLRRVRPGTCGARGARCSSSTWCLEGGQRHEAQVAALAARLRPRHYHLNLIAYKRDGGAGAFRRPAAASVGAFRDRLQAAGVGCTVRRSPAPR